MYRQCDVPVVKPFLIFKVFPDAAKDLVSINSKVNDRRRNATTPESPYEVRPSLDDEGIDPARALSVGTRIQVKDAGGAVEAGPVRCCHLSMSFNSNFGNSSALFGIEIIN